MFPSQHHPSLAVLAAAGAAATLLLAGTENAGQAPAASRRVSADLVRHGYKPIACVAGGRTRYVNARSDTEIIR